MPEITLNIHPGADDMVIDGTSMNDVDSFKAQCLSNGSVSCDWNTLHTRLISHDVSKFWWFLTEPERRSIADMAIRNTLFFNIRSKRLGLLNCEGGISAWTAAICSDDALIRYLKFVSTQVLKRADVGIDEMYWSHPITGEEHCYVPDDCFLLPGHTISCSNFDIGFFHTMCGIHVRPTIDTLDSWVIFQFTDVDIKPGDSQLPKGSTIRAYALTKVGWTFCDGDVVSAFYDV